MKSSPKNIWILLGALFFIGAVYMFTPSISPSYVASSVSGNNPSLETLILKNLEGGTATDLLPYLEQEITLRILEEEDIFPAARAIARLNAFLKQYPPRKVAKKHSGATKSGNTQYLIAQLTSGKEDIFRCYFSLQSQKILSIEISKESSDS